MNNFQLISKTIKDILKTRGLSYCHLADKIGMAESSIKRILNAEDTSIVKLSSIADALDISLFELINLSAPSEDLFFTLDESQERFLSMNLNYMVIFAEMAEGIKDPAELMETFKITEKKLFVYLKKFDDLGLIELGAKNKYKLIPRGQWKIARAGALAQTMIDESYHGFYNVFLKKLETRKDAEYESNTQLVTKDSYKHYLTALAQVNKEFRLSAQRDSIVNKKENLINITTIQGSAVWGPFEHLRATLKY